MTVPSRDSAVGRSIATFLQVLAALAAALPTLALVLNDPNFNLLITRYYPTLVPIVSLLAAVVTLISNVIRKEVPNV